MPLTRWGGMGRETSDCSRIPLHINVKKQFRLKSRLDFQAVYTKGRSVANRAAVVHVLSEKTGTHSRVGFAAGRKLGNAVVRNRIRRRIKEVVRLFWHRARPGIAIVVIARQSALDMPFLELQKKVEELFERAGALTQEGKKS